jgi:signal transduction histidine kinase
VDTLLLAVRQLAERPEQHARLQAVASASADAARRASERLKEIVGRMKAIANLDRAEAQVVDLNLLWKDTVAFLRHELEPRARVTLSLNPLPPVRCRPQQMTAVFSHLLLNAVAAMDARGNIEVSATGTARTSSWKCATTAAASLPTAWPTSSSPRFASRAAASTPRTGCFSCLAPS